MQHHDEDGLRNRPINDLIDDDDDDNYDDNVGGPQFSYTDYSVDMMAGGQSNNSNNNNSNNNSNKRSNRSRKLVKISIIGIAVVLVIGSAVVMILLGPVGQRYGNVDGTQHIIGDTSETKTIKQEAVGECAVVCVMRICKRLSLICIC